MHAVKLCRDCEWFITGENRFVIQRGTTQNNKYNIISDADFCLPNKSDANLSITRLYTLHACGKLLGQMVASMCNYLIILNSK